MIKIFHDKRETYVVNYARKTVLIRGEGGFDYEFMEHRPDGSLYFHAFDPETGRLSPIYTEKIVRTE